VTQITTTLAHTTPDERTGTLVLPPPRPTIEVHARHIRHASAADTAPVVIREGEPVILLTTTAPRCERGVLVWCWVEEDSAYGWRGWWVLDGYNWQVAFAGDELAVWDGREVRRWEEV
jgi:hypothetical protein